MYIFEEYGAFNYFWSTYRDAKLKIANEIKRNLLRDSTRNLDA